MASCKNVQEGRSVQARIMAVGEPYAYGQKRGEIVAGNCL